ncbi:MAG: hypothetical protein KDD45_08320, partial [Bdellovibrionales bacterium]|nr:hypothetical protein [Bdellovibrionales bacterium]
MQKFSFRILSFGLMMIFSCLSSKVIADELASWQKIIPNQNVLVYQGQVIPSQVRTSESVSHITMEGKLRIKELRSQGFICLRKSQVESLCSLVTGLKVLPEGIQKFVDQKVLGFAINFSVLVNEPVLKIDISKQKEWMVDHLITIG